MKQSRNKPPNPNPTNSVKNNCNKQHKLFLYNFSTFENIYKATFLFSSCHEPFMPFLFVFVQLSLKQSPQYSTVFRKVYSLFAV